MIQLDFYGRGIGGQLLSSANLTLIYCEYAFQYIWAATLSDGHGCLEKYLCQCNKAMLDKEKEETE